MSNIFHENTPEYVPWRREKQIRCVKCRGLLSVELRHVNLSECDSDFYDSHVGQQAWHDEPTDCDSDIHNVQIMEDEA
jgi:hypothetical protein